MDNVIMPELITPELAKAIAENPEILSTIMGHQPNEEVIVGQNCTLDCGCNPTNVKLVLCNVTIRLDETEEGRGTSCDTGISGEQVGNCHIKIGSDAVNQNGSQWAVMSWALNQLKLEVAVLEARAKEIEKILKMIPRQACNRKLLARCKAELNEAMGQLSAKREKLEERTRVMQ